MDLRLWIAIQLIGPEGFRVELCQWQFLEGQGDDDRVETTGTTIRIGTGGGIGIRNRAPQTGQEPD